MEKAKENEIKYQEELRKKYNPENMFEKRSITIKGQNIQKTSLVEIKKETFMQKIIKRIQEIFRR